MRVHPPAVGEQHALLRIDRARPAEHVLEDRRARPVRVLGLGDLRQLLRIAEDDEVVRGGPDSGRGGERELVRLLDEEQVERLAVLLATEEPRRAADQPVLVADGVIGVLGLDQPVRAVAKGSTLAGYVVERRLGRGSTAIALLVVDGEKQRRVLKVAADPDRNDRLRDEGAHAQRLTPLLAGVLELLPWVHQWHPDSEPDYGDPPGDFFDDWLDQQLVELGLTREVLGAWRLVARGRGAGRAGA